MKKYIDRFFAGIVALMSWQLFEYWLDRRGYQDLYNVAHSLEARPFVYRVLVPILARMLSKITPLTAVQAMVIVLILFSVILYYSLKYLYETFAHDGRGSVVSFIGCLALFVILIQESKVYDVPTAAFFALCLALLARRKFILFYILFLFASLNRETTFLLSAFFVFYYFQGPISKRHWFLGAAYQALVYVLIRVLIISYFADLPGAIFVSSLQYSLRVYAVHYFLTSAYLICLIWILYLTVRRWHQKPSFLRVAFLVIFPIQVLLHFLLGWPYELRVYAESVPIFSVLIMLPTITLSYNEPNKIPDTVEVLGTSNVVNQPEHL